MEEKNESKFAFVTLATDDSYGQGALVLGHSLRLVNTNHSLVILVTAGVTSDLRGKLVKVFDDVLDVSILDSKDEAKLALLKRPELGITFTKLHCWKLKDYSKCVYLDADTLVLKNCDELFEREELSAVPDVGWPDCFNSGVFVFKPSMDTYKKLLKVASEEGSFDGGDQGLLNVFFKDWGKDSSRILSFIYNMTATASYSYQPAYKKFGDNVKIVHFLGNTKPWMHKYNKQTGFTDLKESSQLYEHLLKWWEIYVQHVDSEDEDGAETEVSKALEDLSFVSPSQSEPPVAEHREPTDNERREAWEHGQIDYMDRDSFEKIQQKIDESISPEND